MLATTSYKHTHQIRGSLIFMFILCPIITLPFILMEIYNGRKYAVGLFFTFLCLVAFYLPPFGDLYRYYSFNFINFKGIKFIDIFEFYITDVIWYAILYLVANLNLSFQIALLISSAIQYSIIYFVLKELNIFNDSNRKRRFWIIIGSAIFTGFWITFAARFYLGASFFLLSILYLHKNKKRLALVWMIIAVLTHFSYIIFAIFTHIVLKFKKLITIKSAILFSCIAYIGVLMIGSYLNTIGFKDSYIENSSNWKESYSITLKLIDYVATGAVYLITILFTITHKIYKGQGIYKLGLAFIALSIATIPFPDIFQRTQYIVVLIGWFLFLLNKNEMSNGWRQLFLYSSILSFLFSSLIYYRAILLSDKSYLWLPIPLALVENNYSYEWINKHIDNGNITNL
ncbi:MAG: hypothetical protein HDS38_00455 [Bacteroides sp.]|nr:hypothetical protein [Bacteroides sp.]